MIIPLDLIVSSIFILIGVFSVQLRTTYCALFEEVVFWSMTLAVFSQHHCSKHFSSLAVFIKIARGIMQYGLITP